MKDKLGNNNKSGKKKLIISLTIILLLAAGALVYYLFFTPEELEEITYQTSQVKQGDITLSIENSGVIKYLDQTTITSTGNGTIKQLYIAENSTVNVNDIILKFDDRNLNIQLEQAYASKRIAELNLANLLQTTHTNIDNVTVDSLTIAVAPIDGIVSYNTHQGANVNSNSAVMKIVDLTEVAVYPQISGSIEEIYVDDGQYVTEGTPLFKINGTTLANQIEIQKQAIYNDQLKIDSLLLELDKTTVKSAKSGVVSELFVEPGQAVGSGAKIATLINNSLVASIEVDELDISQVELGQEAILLIPGYSEYDEIVGVVSYIADSGKVKDGITSYEVQISFEKLENVKEGMTVDAAIILQKAENVLRVASSSVIDVKDGKAVRVFVGDEIVAKKVEIGISDDTMTEIISGLERNETIITSITYPTSADTSTTGSSPLVPTSVKIPGVTGGGGGGGGGQ